MAIFSGAELLDMIMMTLATGFIFMDSFRRPASQDPVQQWQRQKSWRRRFLYAAAIVAPPLLLHELGHKLVAMGYGLTATFEAAYMWLLVGIAIKLLAFPFLVIVPAYVSISGSATPLQHALIAFAGPAVHLLLYLVSLVVLRTRRMGDEAQTFWRYSKFINGFLLVFNLLPIPPFDGYKVFTGLLAAF